MSHVAWSSLSMFVCLSVRRSHGRAVQKRLNRSRCRLGADLCESKEPCIRLGQENPFAAARGDKSAMRPFAKLL